MEYTSAHGCQDGWLGYNDDHYPIPCLTCRPNLAKTAQINDCGETKRPLRRHPVEDVWIKAMEDVFADDHAALDFREAPTPVSLHHMTLIVETSSLPWAAAVQARSETLVGRINAWIGDDVVTTITTVAPAAAATVPSRG